MLRNFVFLSWFFTGKILSGLVSVLDNSGASYSVLYASDPTRSLDYPPVLSRFLSDSISAGNDTIDVVGCDGVCQIKSTLLEGVFVVSSFFFKKAHFLLRSKLYSIHCCPACPNDDAYWLF